MPFFILSIRNIILTICLVLSSSVGAATIHKWVDENGITHYTKEYPYTIDTEVTLIELPSDYQVPNVDQDYYSILNQWARMKEERLAWEQLKAARKQNAQTATTSDARSRANGDEYVNRDVIYVSPWWPHKRPHHHAKPVLQCSAPRSCLLPSRFYFNPIPRGVVHSHNSASAFKSRINIR